MAGAIGQNKRMVLTEVLGSDTRFVADGAVAQLGERWNRTPEVEGSTPFGSTCRNLAPFMDGAGFFRFLSGPDNRRLGAVAPQPRSVKSSLARISPHRFDRQGQRMAIEGRLIKENIRVRRFEVDHNFIGWRLDKYLANRITGMSRSLAGRVAKGGNVEVYPRRKIKAGTRLRLDDEVVLREELEPEIVQDEQVGRLYEDAMMLVLNKPAGMLVHETATVRLNTVTHYLNRQGEAAAEPAHRLDRETSGALVCARTHDSAPLLCGLFADGDPKKVYRALVVDDQRKWAVGAQESIAIGLGKDESSRLGLRMGRGDLEALTHVEVLGRREHPMGELADLRIEIVTGRQHQIRVHLALVGTPIAGDKLYGQSDQFFMDICDHPDDRRLLEQLHFERHALHAWQIALTHPEDGRRLELTAPLPDIFGSL